MPELWDECTQFWKAYQNLNGSRQIGMAAGPIPITEIQAYFELIQLRDVETRLVYLRMIQAVDDERAKYDAKVRESKDKKKK